MYINYFAEVAIVFTISIITTANTSYF